MLRIVFLGSDPIALPALEWLQGEGAALGALAAVFTQPDRPAGRGQKAEPNAIKRWAQARGLPVHQPERITPETNAALRALDPDLSLVMAYGHILKDDFIAIPRLGTVNLHASLLPKYRGASPIQAAIASGDAATGVTLMRIVRELDAGPTADEQRVDIGELDTAREIEAKLSAAGVPLLARALPRLAVRALEFAAQDPSRATYCRRLTKADGALNFFEGARVLAARINALHPWPGCAVAAMGIPLKLGLARAKAAVPGDPLPETLDGERDGDGVAAGRARLKSEGDSIPAGQVLGGDGTALRIATGNGILEVLRLQRPGGRMLAAGEFLRGFPIPAGTVLPSEAMPPLVAAVPFKH